MYSYTPSPAGDPTPSVWPGLPSDPETCERWVQAMVTRHSRGRGSITVIVSSKAEDWCTQYREVLSAAVWIDMLGFS